MAKLLEVSSGDWCLFSTYGRPTSYIWIDADGTQHRTLQEGGEPRRFEVDAQLEANKTPVRVSGRLCGHILNVHVQCTTCLATTCSQWLAFSLMRARLVSGIELGGSCRGRLESKRNQNLGTPVGCNQLTRGSEMRRNSGRQ